jgi:tRNA modification GTPase
MILVDTIAAISTAPGIGAIAIIRLSGKDAWKIASKIFEPGRSESTAQNAHPEGGNAEQWIANRAMFGYVIDMRTRALVDEVVLIPYKGPHSFTGEDLVEINCHGGAVVTREILNLCLAGGARLARAGEFTERAFLNGKIDLVQAEAINDLISAKTARQSHLAVSALKGELGRKIHETRATLIELLTRVNAGIDFPEEVGDIPLDDVSTKVSSVKTQLEKLAATTRSGKFLREGLRLAIVGKPNAGKSSLLNQLLNFDRAIVTEIPGTTRDALEEVLDINGIPVILTDTAGIRYTEDPVEQIGIERSIEAAEAADLVLFVCDLDSRWSELDKLIVEMIGEKPFITLGNKMDVSPEFATAFDKRLPNKDRDNESKIQQADAGDKRWALYKIANTARPARAALRERQPVVNEVAPAGQPDLLEDTKTAALRLPISAKTGENLDKLSQWIEQWALSTQNPEETGGSLNARQGELCLKTIEALNLVLDTVKSDMPQDCLATDLKGAVDNLSEVCGEVVSEEVISNIFATFCIGK